MAGGVMMSNLFSLTNEQLERLKSAFSPVTA
jgi:hypothetical protein